MVCLRNVSVMSHIKEIQRMMMMIMMMIIIIILGCPTVSVMMGNG